MKSKFVYKLGEGQGCYISFDIDITASFIIELLQRNKLEAVLNKTLKHLKNELIEQINTTRLNPYEEVF